MTIQEAAKPKLAAGWVLVKVETVGICGSEISGYLGENELRRPPLVMGHEFSGTVAECGPATDLAVGSRVTANPLVSCGVCRDCRAGQRQRCLQRRIIGIDYPGGYAEWVAVPAAQCYPVADAVDGAMVEPLACALRAVELSEVETGDDTVVVGAGIIGLMAAGLLAQAGARRVAVVDPNPTRRQAAIEWRASAIFASTNELSSGFPERVDRVIDAVGLGATRRQSLEVLRRGGRAVWIGLHENLTEVAGNAVVRDETSVVGSFCYTDHNFSRAVQLVNDGHAFPAHRGWLDLRPLEAGDAAFREQARGPAPYAKILLRL